jgi:energy-coupling factor transporter ATP-binding protein EcfA2
VVLEVGGLTKGYGGPPVFEGVSFDVERGERLLVMGLNGAGKTSLLRILAGVTEPDAGGARVGHGVSMGYYAQEHELLRDEVSVIAHVRGESTDASDQDLRALLGMFGLTGDVAFQESGTLSGARRPSSPWRNWWQGGATDPARRADEQPRPAVQDRRGRGAVDLVRLDGPSEPRRGIRQALAPQRVLMMPEGELSWWDDELLGLVALA